MAERIIIFPDEAISKRYTIRRSGKGTTIEACLPRDAIAREARRKNMSIDEFLKAYEAEYLYNDFGGLHIKFVEKED